MTLTDNHLRIMNIFRDANLGRGHYMPWQSLMGEKFDLERPLQDKFDRIVEELLEMGYIEKHRLGLVLTASGYQLIYGE